MMPGIALHDLNENHLNDLEHGCRPGCGACCIAPSISSPITGMPNGKPAGVACIHLTPDHLCGIFGQPGRPGVCSDFSFDPAVCGNCRDEALQRLQWLEEATRL
ncbi:hypothetical protein SAMN02745752_00329 [Marinospirillum alkaliphilum DSM 21637]|uniref:Zinc-or iron-chelating domain-containing protein n=2 Tax=Marinospirillum TaxID=64968 RepID=A0A1K1TWT6_9GAMM|nr:hypothetical protein SAMN02745752_00329 [Marinospirillum alkaliphilum DSM 21637]